MFALEQEEYVREGIVWTFIDFGLDLHVKKAPAASPIVLWCFLLFDLNLIPIHT